MIFRSICVLLLSGCNTPARPTEPQAASPAYERSTGEIRYNSKVQQNLDRIHTDAKKLKEDLQDRTLRVPIVPPPDNY